VIATAEPTPTRTKERPEDQRERLRKTISASRLSLWLQCRFKFYFHYIARIPKRPTPARHAGSTVPRATVSLSADRGPDRSYG
jgi:hypothetical protein